MGSDAFQLKEALCYASRKVDTVRTPTLCEQKPPLDVELNYVKCMEGNR
jgi:hypothetical protein